MFLFFTWSGKPPCLNYFVVRVQVIYFQETPVTKTKRKQTLYHYFSIMCGPPVQLKNEISFESSQTKFAIPFITKLKSKIVLTQNNEGMKNEELLLMFINEKGNSHLRINLNA